MSETSRPARLPVATTRCATQPYVPQPFSIQRLSALLGVLLVLSALITLAPVSTPRADALTMNQRLYVLQVAASRQGAPYQYGAAGPWRFDCSGYTQWVFAHLGRHLPHSSAMQSTVVRHIPASDRQRGDLVFFTSGGHVYHVGIYAGLGRIWHAPHTGSVVHRERLWTSHVFYGRVR
jgi:cell wall-associated NlpC family hydrolase